MNHGSIPVVTVFFYDFAIKFTTVITQFVNDCFREILKTEDL